MNKYNYFSTLYDELTEEMDYTPWIDLLKKYNGKVLDVGCGSATLLILLIQLGYECDGLDLSESMIEIAKKKLAMNHLNTNLYIGNMINFSIDNKYDIITCFFDTLNHLNNEGDLNKTLINMSNHLNNDGVLLVDLFTKEKMNDIDNEEFIFDEFTYHAVWKMKSTEKNIIHNLEFKIGNKIIEEEYIETYFDIKKNLPETLTIISETPIIVDEVCERIVFTIKKL